MAPQTPEELAAVIEADGIEFLFAMFVDLQASRARSSSRSPRLTRC